jgi:hypothetical protein
MCLTFVHLSVDLRASLTLIYEAEKLPVIAEGARCLGATQLSPSFPSTLVEYPIEKAVEDPQRNVLVHLLSISSCVFAVSVK